MHEEPEAVVTRQQRRAMEQRFYKMNLDKATRRTLTKMRKSQNKNTRMMYREIRRQVLAQHAG